MRNPAGYWTYEKCKEVALLYNSRKNLVENYSGAYSVIYKNKWFELIPYYSKSRLPNGYWTYDKCKEIASTFEYRSKFEKKYKSAYKKIIENGWFELFNHMKRMGNKYKRLIYVYEFNDNVCYVGLTGDIERRNNEHTKTHKDSPVYNHIIKYNILYKLILKCDYIDVEKAVILEEKILTEYKNNGWIILNKTKTGGIGLDNAKWNKETCKKESLKYDRIVDFMKKSGRAYYISIKNKWIDEFFPIRQISKKGYWNDKDLCEKESKKYSTRSEFGKGSWSAYNYTIKNKWIDEFFPNKKVFKNI